MIQTVEIEMTVDEIPVFLVVRYKNYEKDCYPEIIDVEAYTMDGEPLEWDESLNDRVAEIVAEYDDNIDWH